MMGYLWPSGMGSKMARRHPVPRVRRVARGHEVAPRRFSLGQRPSSAKGVMFITIADKTGVTNLVVWTKVFVAHRRVVLGAGMMGVRGRVQREGEVVHVIAHKLADCRRSSPALDVGAGRMKTQPARRPLGR